MFYSQEVLTSRKYGVATVWLVATLGSKSALKKVSRKAISNVDVQKACETIVAPEAPMALRLQSNLLYGVTRVYFQQCTYVLADAESAKNSLCSMFKTLDRYALDADGEHRASAEHLVLQDDPNFLPDFDLVPADLNRLSLDFSISSGSQHSVFSPYSSQKFDRSVGMGTQQDIGGLIIPPSASSLDGGPADGLGSFGVRSNSGAMGKIETGNFLEDDLGLVIQDDGIVLISDGPRRQPTEPLLKRERTEPGSASSRVRREHEEGQLGRNIFGQLDDDGSLPLQDDYVPLLGSVPFPRADRGAQQQTSSETAEALSRHHGRAVPKPIPFDFQMELPKGDIARWGTDYVANMNNAIRQKNASRAAAIAKKNAETWMLGELTKGCRGPLDIFTGARLLEALTGVAFRGEKRPRDEGDESHRSRNVRPRERLSDEGFIPILDDDTVEQAREAPTPLDDDHISGAFPWNQSADSRSVYSGPGLLASASLRGLTARRGSRLTSASPLIGRGTVGGDVDNFQLHPSSQDIGMTGAGVPEPFDPVAQVDTQTAAQSQWQRAMLDGESMHFFEFVRASIAEVGRTLMQMDTGDEDSGNTGSFIDFDVLLPPDNHSHIVAAQALLHVLSLGTKNLLVVEQTEGFGTITMRVMTAAQ